MRPRRARASGPAARDRVAGGGSLSAAEKAPGRLHVLRYLGGELGHVGELDLVMEPVHEAQPEPLLVEVTGEVEQVGLYAKLGAREGRPVADADAGHVLVPRRDGPAGVDATGRH